MRVMPPCPHLPEAPETMDYRSLRCFPRGRGEGFHAAALTYAQYLWMEGLPARSILALARAFHGDQRTDTPLRPAMPYAALRWICERRPPDRFLGNPRLSFQHQARRMGGPRLAPRRARAWAAWKVCATALPALPDDTRDPRPPPATERIADALREHGYPGETELWLGVVRGAPEGPFPPPLT